MSLSRAVGGRVWTVIGVTKCVEEEGPAGPVPTVLTVVRPPQHVRVVRCSLEGVRVGSAVVVVGVRAKAICPVVPLGAHGTIDGVTNGTALVWGYRYGKKLSRSALVADVICPLS